MSRVLLKTFPARHVTAAGSAMLVHQRLEGTRGQANMKASALVRTFEQAGGPFTIDQNREVSFAFPRRLLNTHVCGTLMANSEGQLSGHCLNTGAGSELPVGSNWTRSRLVDGISGSPGTELASATAIQLPSLAAISCSSSAASRKVKPEISHLWSLMALEESFGLREQDS